MYIPLIGNFVLSMGNKPKKESIEQKVSPVSAPANGVANNPPMPVTSGRSSEVVNNGSLGNLLADMATVDPKFRIELLDLCEYLAIYNGDVSYAVDNIVQLGNTTATITLSNNKGKIEKELSSKMLGYLNEAEKNIYVGGMNSLQNDLFAQAAITGALSAEAIPNRKLNGIEKVVLVAPRNISFKYNPKNYKYEPYQKVANGLVNGKANAEGLVKLNPATYRYAALRLFGDNPYGIPPFISALETIELEKDMMKNMRHIVKKLGMFGFLKILVQPPTRKQGEDEAVFFARAKSYLNDIRAESDKGYNEGMLLGFKGTEVDMAANNTNIAGARELFELVMQIKAAGLKQDPLMLGRNFNVAETMARVIMAKLTTQVANYQRLIAAFRADVYMLMLRMAGFDVTGVAVEYEAPMIGDKLRDEQAYAAKIDNRIKLRDKGIIAQDDAANELDYLTPAAKKDVDYSVPSAADAAKTAAKSATDPKNTKDPSQASDATGTGAN